MGWGVSIKKQHGLCIAAIGSCDELWMQRQTDKMAAALVNKFSQRGYKVSVRRIFKEHL